MTDLVEKLRQNIWFAVNHPHLRAVCDAGFEAANEIERLLDAVEELSAENEQLRTELEKVRAWQEAGEEILSTPYYRSLSFSIGKWWGERPWK